MMKPSDPNKSWFYMSFADEDSGENLGATVVEAYNLHDATPEAWRRGVNPGGQVLIMGPLDDLPDQLAPLVNNLLSKEQIEQFDGVTDIDVDDNSTSTKEDET
jgi:hypothetical protein